MTVKLSSGQIDVLRRIRGGNNTSPPNPMKTIESLKSKGLIQEYRDRFGTVRYSLTEAGWRFF